MNILFVYSVQKSILQKKPLLGQAGIYFGISSVAALLKKHGHSCELVVLDRKYKQKNIALLSHKITAFNPQVIAFTAVYSEFEFISQIAAQLKAFYPRLFFYAGGIHITLNPDEKYLEIFDILCVGEGEYPTLELIQKLEKGEDIQTIPNLWIKISNGIAKNPARPHIADLDQLPFPDREMWQPWILDPNTNPAVLLGRGCPFNCTYCSNHRLRKVSSGRYVRLRSAENIIAEIRELHNSFPLVDEIYLEIETLGTNLKWLDAFCEKLHQFGEETEFKLKFATNLRIFPSLDTEAVFANFKKANILSTTIGLESGNYRIRKEILHRDYSNEMILEAALTAKKHGIDIALFNMVGLPTETPETFSETVAMNQLIQPVFHATSIFFPYPGTELYELCKQMNLLPKKLDTQDERQIATLDLPGFSKKQIQKSFDSFHYKVYKAKENKSILKLLIYFSMQYVGHNFYANFKVFFIRSMYKLKARNMINRKFVSIFQKSK